MIASVAITIFLCVLTSGFVIKATKTVERRFATGLTLFTLLQQVGYFVWLKVWEWPWNPVLSAMIALVQLSVFLQMDRARKSNQACASDKRATVKLICESLLWPGMVWLILNTTMSHLQGITSTG
ncbi:hypothetical protein [Lelliottia sp.]|uniref:hypothetical protein n=1 Tax=Lelliottia sp. TaxID=1898429 RepID=UPI00388F7D68